MSEYKRPSFFEAPLGYIIAPVILYLLFFYLSDQMRLVIIASVIGALLGCFTGLVPGIHANTIAILLFSLTIAIEQFLNFLSGTIDVSILIVVAIASTSITHTFLNFIPGTVLGAPEENNALGVLPMHEMIMRKPVYQCIHTKYIYNPKEHNNVDLKSDFECPGLDLNECGRKAYEEEHFRILEKAPGYLAIYYSAIGSLYAAIFCILLILPLKIIFGRESLIEERGYDVAKEFMLEILLIITLIMFLTDKARGKFFKYKSGNSIYTFFAFKESMADRRLINGEDLPNISTLTRKKKKEIDEGRAKFLLTENGLDLGWQGRIIGLIGVAIVFFLSGAFGWLVLNQIEGSADSPLNPYLRENFGFYLPTTTLFPAFTGLFGIATLLFSISSTPKYGPQNLGIRNPKYRMIDLEKNRVYTDLSSYKLGGLRKWIFSWFKIQKVPRFQCGKCSIYYKEKLVDGSMYHEPKCNCNKDYRVESINYSNSVIGAITGAAAGLLPGITAGIGTILAMFTKNRTLDMTNTLSRMHEDCMHPKEKDEKVELNDTENVNHEENEFSGRNEDVIMTLAAVNTAASLTILAGLFIILRPRNGTTIVIDQMASVNEWLIYDEMPLLLTCLLIGVLVSIIIGFVFTATTGVKAMSAIIKLREWDPKFAPKAMWIMIASLFVLVWIFTGFVGVSVMGIGTFIGLIPPILGVRKSHAMGFLLVPVMIFYYNMSGSGLFS